MQTAAQNRGNLSRAQIPGVDLSHTDLSGADLSYTENYLGIVSLSVALILLFATLSYGASSCEAIVADQIKQTDFDEADVRKIAYVARRRSGEANFVRGIDASVSFHSCKGSLEINMTRECRIKQVYTRGGCRSAGIPSY